MESHSWRVADSRALLENTWGRWADLLVCCCQSMVMATDLDHKDVLARCVRDASLVMADITARHADVRGVEAKLGELWRQSADFADEVSPQEIVAALDPQPHHDKAVLLYDADTWRVLDLVAIHARTMRELLSGPVESALVKVSRTWTLPRRPGRPDHLRLCDQVQPVSPDAAPGAFLHGVIFTIELCAAELCAASLALDALNVPSGLIVDLGKQVFDEMRHFQMLAGLLDRHETTIGDHPVDTLIWDKFLVGESLAERLVIEQRLGEGVGLDGGYALYEKYTADDDMEAAQCFDFINADEMTHVRNGNRWISHLAGGDDNRAELDERMRARLAGHSWPVRHSEPINIADRYLAEFTPGEILSIKKMARTRPE